MFKINNKIGRYILWSALFLVVFDPVIAQDNEAAIKSAVNRRNYAFVAEDALPARGRIIHLTSNYEVSVSKDTIDSYLPYYGRSYVAPMNTSDLGIKFASSDFEYIQKDRKKGGWEITIKPKDADDVQQLFLTIHSNGNANLQVLSNSRQSIGFTGYIKERK